MRKLLLPISLIGLLLTILPSILVFSGTLTLSSHKFYMTIGMILWFASASILFKEDDTTEDEAITQ